MTDHKKSRLLITGFFIESFKLTASVFYIVINTLLCSLWLQTGGKYPQVMGRTRNHIAADQYCFLVIGKLKAKDIIYFPAM